MAKSKLPSSTRTISSVAAELTGSLSPLLAYSRLTPLAENFGAAGSPNTIRRALKAALSEAERFPQPRLASVGSAQHNMIRTNTYRRAAYIVSATKRIAEQLANAQSHGESSEAALSEAISRENQYFLQHVKADAERIFAASRIDSLAGSADILGWYAHTDGKTTSECLTANGKNFRVSDPPAIGYPGSTHVECRCYPGPPHRDAEMLPSASEPVAMAGPVEFDAVEFTQRVADLFDVPVELAKPRKKVSKQSVDYRRATNAAKRCGTCVMYQASRCDLVEGYIDPRDVCDKWEAKPNAVELAFVPGPNPNAVRHVRSARGVEFFKEPIGTPITEEQYQALLASRRSAKEMYEVGHPERVKAERAVRQARKLRGGSADIDTPQGGQDGVEQEVSEVQQNANNVLASVKLKSEVTGAKKPAVTKESEQLLKRLAELKQIQSTREAGKNANLASRVDDRRLAQGQTKSAFVRPNGSPMSKSEIGDTYEQLFSTHGAPLLERIFGKPYEMISHAHGGSRNTPLDFRLGHAYGGELKTMSATSESAQRGKLKTAIKKEEIDRKLAALQREGLKPLLVVQVVNQSDGKVDIYTHDAFSSKFVKTMRYVGSYAYTTADFHEANVKAGYGSLISDASTGPSTELAPVAAHELSFDKSKATRKLNGDFTFKHLTKAGDPNVSRIRAYDSSGTLAGELSWKRGPAGAGIGTDTQDAAPGEILMIRTETGYQRLGLASAMIDAARQNRLTPYPQHSDHTTPDGKGFVKGRPIDAMAARLTADQEYQRLLDIRRQMQAKYPVGHPERVKAERSVRQARKQIHFGDPQPPERPKPAIPERPVSTNKTGQLSTHIRETSSGRPGSTNTIGFSIKHGYVWSGKFPVNQAFRQNTEDAISRAFDHQSKLLPDLLHGGSVDIHITDTPPRNSAGSSALGTMIGSEHSAQMTLSPRIFDHVVRTPGGRAEPASFFLKTATPTAVLKTAQDSNWWVPVDPKWELSDVIISHETGHGVHDSLFPNNSSVDRGIPQDKAFWTQLSKHLGVRKPTAGVSYRPRASFAPHETSVEEVPYYSYETIARWLGRNRNEIADRVSEYAASAANDNKNLGKPRELLAELWSEASLSSHPRAPAKFYGDYVKNKLSERSARNAAREAELPPEIREYDPAKLSVGESVTLKSVPVRIERIAASLWDVILLNANGNFSGAYGANSPSEVKRLITSEWQRRKR